MWDKLIHDYEQKVCGEWMEEINLVVDIIKATEFIGSIIATNPYFYQHNFTQSFSMEDALNSLLEKLMAMLRIVAYEFEAE